MSSSRGWATVNIIVVSCLLASLYPDLSVDEVLERTQKSFELRARGIGKWVNPKRQSPASEEQPENLGSESHGC